MENEDGNNNAIIGYILAEHRGYIGIMESKMESTVSGLGFRV